MNCIRPRKELMVLLYVAFVFSFYQMQVIVVEARHRLTNKDLEVNDKYDCTDFYKQITFDHPLLANHSFHPEMRPSSTPVTWRSRAYNVSVNHVDVGFKGVGCPVGTVPIRKVSEKDRIRERWERLHAEKYQSKYNTLSQEHPGTHYAKVRTKWNPKNKYYGAAAELSLWNPSVEPDQYSSGQIVLRNGDENIQVGWTVNPYLYGDNRTRTFIYTGAGPRTQCFNMYCPGFVIVNNKGPIDAVPPHVSTRGKEDYYTGLLILKDARDGNWWLINQLGNRAIGFWPKNIFSSTGLSDAATSVEWGGLVNGPTNVPSAPMGSGGDVKGDTRYDAYCTLVSIVNEARKLVEPPSDDIERYASDSSKVYKVVDAGNVGGNFGRLVYYGGQGGAVGN